MQLKDLPPPECPGGYTRAQITEIFGDDEDRFWAWFTGQTGSICDGRRYDHEKQAYEPTECAGAPHGPVVYPWDMREYVQYDGRRTTDW